MLNLQPSAVGLGRLFDQLPDAVAVADADDGAIRKAIVELHGGAVGLESAPGEGACFWFTLPLAEKLCIGEQAGAG